jgi:hypothetical protein
VASPQVSVGWRVLGASVPGTAHRRADRPCQDAHAYRALADGALLVTADGAGSAEFAEAGARVAVAAALTALAHNVALGWPSGEQVWRAAFAEAYAAAREAVLQAAAEQGAPPRAFASTLLCAALSADLLAVAQLGDGVAVAQAATGDWFAAAAPQRGEYANETRFLVQPDALSYVEVQVYAEAVPALAVMTDGLLRLVLDLPTLTPHAPFFNPLLSFATSPDASASALADFLDSPRVNARTDDDKTLVLAVRWPSAAPA